MMTVRRALWTALILAGIAGAIQAQDEGQPTIREFSLPEYNDKMELVSKIRGDKAKSRGLDVFEITNLQYEMFKDGKVSVRVTSPFCYFDKKKKAGNSENSIRIAQDDVVITGEDYEFSGENGRIHIRKNAKVVLRSVDIRIWGDEDDK